MSDNKKNKKSGLKKKVSSIFDGINDAENEEISAELPDAGAGPRVCQDADQPQDNGRPQGAVPAEGGKDDLKDALKKAILKPLYETSEDLLSTPNNIVIPEPPGSSTPPAAAERKEEKTAVPEPPVKEAQSRPSDAVIQELLRKEAEIYKRHLLMQNAAAKEPPPKAAESIAAPSPAAGELSEQELISEKSYYPSFSFKQKSLLVTSLMRIYNPNRVGLDIGTNSIKIIEIKAGGRGSFALEGFGFKEFDSGDISKELTPISDYIKEVYQNSHCKKKYVATAVSGGKINIASFLVPNLPKKGELDAAVKWEFSKQSTINLSEAAFDYSVLYGLLERKERLQVIAAAAGNGILNERIELLESGGLHAEFIGIVPFALENLMKYCEYAKKGEGTVFLDIGAAATTVAFFKGSVLQFAREIGAGGNDYTAAIAGTMASDKGPLIVDQACADDIKKRYGIPDGDIVCCGKKVPLSQITGFIRPELERFVNEVQRSITYYLRLFKVEKIDKILLCGGGSNLKNLDGFLSKALNVPVKKVNPVLDLGLSSGLDEAEINEVGPRFAVALGLALSAKPKINLIPSGVREKRSLKIMEFAVTVFSFITLLFFGGLYLFIGQQTEFYEAQLTDVKKVYTSIEPVLNKLKEYDTLNGKLNERKKAMESVLKRQPQWDAVLKEIGYLIPNDTFLTNVSVVKDSEPRAVKIDGIAQGAETADVGGKVALFMNALSKSPFFRLVDLKSQKDVPGYDESAASFTITAEIVY